MKLKIKFSIFSSILILAVIAILSTFLIIAQKQLLIKEIRGKEILIATSFAQVSKEYLINNDQLSLINFISGIKKEKTFVYAALTDTKGRIINHSDISLIGNLLNDALEPHILSSDKLLTHKFTDTSGRSIEDISIPVILNGKTEAFTRTGFSLDEKNKLVSVSMAKIRNMILMIAGIALFAGIIGSFVLASFMVSPIKKMTDAAKFIGEGKLDTKITVTSKDELGELAKDLNMMSEKLKDLDQRKQDFIASVTHELRSPLTIMMISVESLIETMGNNISKDQEETIEILKNNIKRQTLFVNDLLDAAKIERGKMEIKRSLCDIRKAISEPVGQARVLAGEKTISIETNIAEDITDVSIDTERIQQVLMNLLSNAVKFTPKNGKITVTAKNTGTDFIIVSVCDTGIGIPKEYQDKVFEKFEQVKSTVQESKKPKGTGLGLAIAKAIVELHGGKIWVESEPGKGSCFRFIISKSDKPKV